MDFKTRIAEIALLVLAIVPIFMVLSKRLPYFAKRDKEKRHKRMVEYLRAVWWRCPACNGSYTGHQRLLLASVILDSDARRTGELASLIRAHQWEQAMQIREWKGDRDEREYHIVRCPKSTQLSMITLISLWELWADDYVEATQVLDDESTKALLRLAGDRWEPFPF
jgi:hypothetical protein